MVGLILLKKIEMRPSRTNMNNIVDFIVQVGLECCMHELCLCRSDLWGCVGLRFGQVLIKCIVVLYVHTSNN